MNNLYTGPLLHMYLQTYSPSIACFSIFLWTSTEQKLLILMRTNLSLFLLMDSAFGVK